MSTFQFSKKRVQVRLQIGKRLLEGEVFLSPVTVTGRSETVSDLLAHSDPFFPLVESGCVRCVPREAISVCEVSLEDAVAQEVTALESHEVEVRFQDGRPVRGFLRYSLPPEGQRVVDYLNTLGAFIPLHATSRVSFINRRYIEEVVVQPVARSKKKKVKSRRVRPARRARV